MQILNTRLILADGREYGPGRSKGGSTPANGQ